MAHNYLSTKRKTCVLSVLHNVFCSNTSAPQDVSSCKWHRCVWHTGHWVTTTLPKEPGIWYTLHITGLLVYRGYIYPLISMGRDSLHYTARLPVAAKHTLVVWFWLYVDLDALDDMVIITVFFQNTKWVELPAAYCWLWVDLSASGDSGVSQT